MVVSSSRLPARFAFLLYLLARHFASFFFGLGSRCASRLSGGYRISSDGFLVLSLFGYPPVLSIEVDGVGLCSWLGHEKKIRWEDVSSLRYNTGKQQFAVCANDGRKITHTGFNAEPGLFQNEIQKHIRLPMKITRSGTGGTEPSKFRIGKSKPKNK